jgi:hypothetical protein
MVLFITEILRAISGLRRGVVEVSALLGGYAVYGGGLRLRDPRIGTDRLSRGVGKQLPTRCITSENSKGLNMDEFTRKVSLRLTL